MYNLIENSDNYSTTLWILWQYCKDEPALDSNNSINDFDANDATSSWLKIKEKITSHTGNNGTKIYIICVLLTTAAENQGKPLLIADINFKLQL